MTITICGSMSFHQQMKEAQARLEKRDFTILLPEELADGSANEALLEKDEDKISAKIEYNFIREHFKKVEMADSILILNYPKKGIDGYIGGNTFLEMGYAFGLGKKIFLLYPIPKMDYFTEMSAIQPIVLNGNLNLIE